MSEDRSYKMMLIHRQLGNAYKEYYNSQVQEYWEALTGGESEKWFNRAMVAKEMITELEARLEEIAEGR